MTCDSHIKEHNTNLQEDRVYIFLDGLDDRLDNAHNDVLQMALFPTVEPTYAFIRLEDLRQAVMMDTQVLTSASLAAKGTHQPAGHPLTSRPSQPSSFAFVPLQIQSYTTVVGSSSCHEQQNSIVGLGLKRLVALKNATDCMRLKSLLI
ncbi:hypothetical protein L3X38_012726 [Prunus dulcis]|uniref:Uncharacterized protein n=1 Tax=Prunus dulcis TaxID=3755 RepID=A0AAD4WK50_PRUDU|nr:hypothetical protein L3X38_012726 [Prunus dulcis]